MSSSFDSIERWFRERFEPKSGSKYEKHLFSMILADLHGANHELDDVMNRSPRVRRAVRAFEEYLAEEKE